MNILEAGNDEIGLLPIDINSLPIIFDENADACCTLENSYSHDSEKTFCNQLAGSNKVPEKSNENTDPRDRDYIPEIGNYSNSSDSEMEELQNRIDPVRMHIDEDPTSQTVV